MAGLENDASRAGGAHRLDEVNLIAYLEPLGVLPGADRVERVGEGNLNFVRRVRARDGASVIVKQARTGIEGFPEFPLSSVRILYERRYEEVVRELAPGGARVLPRVLHFDTAARILVMEDIGERRSLLEELRAGCVPAAAIRQLGAFLGHVHAATRARADALRPRFDNEQMRDLHGAQIFAAACAVPALSGACADAVERELADTEVPRRLAELRRAYYGRSDALVHGDVKSANVLLYRDEPRLIDAEFAHIGDPAFDLGTGLAHLFLCMLERAPSDSSERAECAWLEGYTEQASDLRDHAEIVARARRYAGADMIYHVLGAARLPFFEAEDSALAMVRRGIELLCSE